MRGMAPSRWRAALRPVPPTLARTLPLAHLRVVNARHDIVAFPDYTDMLFGGIGGSHG